METQTTELAIAEVWKLFKETSAQFKETDARIDRGFVEMNRQREQRLAEMQAEIAKTRQESEQQLSEMRTEIAKTNREREARLDQRFAETSAELARTSAEVAKTSAEVAKTNKALRRLEGIFSNQWGRLIEALVQPGVLKLFQERGHDVRRLHQRSKAKMNGNNMEIDIILEDQTEVIPIEVKTTLTVERVNEFLDDLAEFTHFFPLYKTYRIYGAVAGLDISLDVIRYAYRKGLFVVSITGNDLVQIENDEKFRPKDFGPDISAQESQNESDVMAKMRTADV